MTTAWILFKASWYVAAATLLMAVQPLLTAATQNSEGGYDYFVLTVTLMAEQLKLSISAMLYARLPSRRRTHWALEAREVLAFAVPAVLYAINNNVMFLIVLHISSTTFQILSALKTVFTGLLFRLVLKRTLSRVQVSAVVLLATGAAVSQLPTAGTSAAACAEDGSGASVSVADPKDANVQDGWIGVLLTVCSCLLSALAGIYSEQLLKTNGKLHSIHLQNMLLYAFGVLINLACLLIKDGAAIMASQDGLVGYTPLVWLLVVNNACNGLAISAVLKFADNIIRVFAHTAAMMLTLVVEAATAQTRASAHLLLSIILVGNATFLYATQAPPKTPSPRQTAEVVLSMPD